MRKLIINGFISLLIMFIVDSCSLLDKVIPKAAGLKIGLQAGDNEYKIHNGREQNVQKNSGIAIGGNETKNSITGSKQVIIQSQIIDMRSGERRSWEILVAFLVALNYLFLSMRPPHMIWLDWKKRRGEAKLKQKAKLKAKRKRK